MANDTTNELLADISVRIQLPPSMYKEAVQRYETVSDHLERADSPLKDKVTEIYTQGSIAIGATIRSARSQDSDIYDVDLIAEIESDVGVTPNDYLDVLYESIKGKKGSRYFDKTERQTRCVTIEYADMHVDITPMVRRSAEHLSISRAGVISHADPEKLNEQKFVENNSTGLSTYINNNVPNTSAFSKMYTERLQAFDQSKHFLMEKAEVQPAPEQESIEEKSITIVALQLIKRRMQILWQDKTREKYRKPPSVILSLLAAQNALGSMSLMDEVIHLCNAIGSKFNHAHKIGIANPEYYKDILTDRWPEDHRVEEDQKMLSGDLYELATRLKAISQLGLAQKRVALGELFGEALVTEAYNTFYKRNFMDTKADAREVIPKAGSILLAGVAAPVSAKTVTPPATKSWGGPWED